MSSLSFLLMLFSIAVLSVSFIASLYFKVRASRTGAYLSDGYNFYAFCWAVCACFFAGLSGMLLFPVGMLSVPMLGYLAGFAAGCITVVTTLFVPYYFIDRHNYRKQGLRVTEVLQQISKFQSGKTAQ